MNKSKNINLFLIDGNYTGRIKATMLNWTGVVYKIPKAFLEECMDKKSEISKALQNAGIYFLLGETPET